jgi:hypothetical protein
MFSNEHHGTRHSEMRGVRVRLHQQACDAAQPTTHPRHVPRKLGIDATYVQQMVKDTYRLRHAGVRNVSAQHITKFGLATDEIKGKPLIRNGKS